MSTLSRLREKPFPVSDMRLALLVSIAAFLVLRSVHLVIRFQELGIARVAGATLIFAALASAGLWVGARTSSFRFERPTNPWTWLITAGLAVFWWLASSPVKSVFTKVYAPEFPVRVIDSGGKVAADTFFHSSLVSSIMHFGYPSTGLDGTPLTPYHVLSHYVDAAILNFTGLAPLDSAGFLLQLKVMLFVVAIVSLLWVQLRAMPSWIQWLTPVLVLPAFSATWHVVGSHGLWFTSLLVIVSAPFVFSLISTTTRPPSSAYIALAFLGAALSFGKISTGFMFMFVVGLMLWMRKIRDVRVYVLGVAWAGFMVVYASSIASDRPDATAVTYTLTERAISAARFLLMRDLSGNLMLGLYALIAVFIVVAVVRPTTFHRQLLGVALGGTAIVLGLAVLMFDENDRWYFSQALFFILLTMSIGVFAQFAQDTEPVSLPKTGRTAARRTVVAVTVLVALGVVGARSDFSLVKPSPTVIGVSLSSAFTVAPPAPATDDGLGAFGTALTEFAAANNLTAHNAQLFIPRELWNDVDPTNSAESDPLSLWPLPMMVYAETGIPLYKGVYVTHESYGFSAYGPESLTPTRDEFENSTKCGGTAIIEVTSWAPASFTLACEVTR